MAKELNLLFAATSDYLPFATVTAISAFENLFQDCKINVHFLYADIVTSISDKKRLNIFETAQETFNRFNINFVTYDISNKIHLLKGQNIGMWGENISLTHYMYLLAPIVLENIEKVIFLDTDMIVNCDLSKLLEINFGDKLLAMGAPRGMEEMGDDVSNSGFVVLNLKQWRSENTLDAILEFGRNLPKSRFCDQNLLYQYFTKLNSNRLLLVDKEYNIFPQLFYELDLQNIKILHFTGYHIVKPWLDDGLNQRGAFLWWKYARKTDFCEYFLLNSMNKRIFKKKNQSLKQIFSVKNSSDKTHKILTILGIKIKFKKIRKNKQYE